VGAGAGDVFDGEGVDGEGDGREGRSATGYGKADTFVVYHSKSGPAKLERVITISDIKYVSEQSEGIEVIMSTDES
jgi:hypothetical protein